MEEDRLIELEARVAYQDKTIDEINEVLVAQQAKISQLEGKVEAILLHLKASAVDSAGE